MFVVLTPAARLFSRRVRPQEFVACCRTDPAYLASLTPTGPQQTTLPFSPLNPGAGSSRAAAAAAGASASGAASSAAAPQALPPWKQGARAALLVGALHADDVIAFEKIVRLLSSVSLSLSFLLPRRPPCLSRKAHNDATFSTCCAFCTTTTTAPQVVPAKEAFETTVKFAYAVPNEGPMQARRR